MCTENIHRAQKGEKKGAVALRRERWKVVLRKGIRAKIKEVREGAPWISGERCPVQREQGTLEGLRAAVAGQQLGKASGDEMRDDGIGQRAWEAFSL